MCCRIDLSIVTVFSERLTTSTFNVVFLDYSEDGSSRPLRNVVLNRSTRRRVPEDMTHKEHECQKVKLCNLDVPATFKFLTAVLLIIRDSEL